MAITFRVLQIFSVSKVWLLVGPFVWTKESALNAFRGKRRDRTSSNPLSKERERERRYDDDDDDVDGKNANNNNNPFATIINVVDFDNKRHENNIFGEDDNVTIFYE